MWCARYRMNCHMDLDLVWILIQIDHSIHYSIHCHSHSFWICVCRWSQNVHSRIFFLYFFFLSFFFTSILLFKSDNYQFFFRWSNFHSAEKIHHKLLFYLLLSTEFNFNRLHSKQSMRLLKNKSESSSVHVKAV